MNLFHATITDAGAVAGTLTVPLTAEQRSAVTSDKITVGVRPGDVDVATDGGLNSTVTAVEELGSEAFLYCEADGTHKELVARVEGLSGAKVGDVVSLIPRSAAMHMFDTATGARLPA